MGHAFIRKVHVLYQRVLRKYPGNVGLWLDFATFCFSHGNARLLSEVTSQGLRLNPSCAGLWCFAANWEYKHKGDISAARRLLLRGLRNCAQSKVLWQVYFRLELKVAADVRARNEALGLPAVAAGANPGAVAEAVFAAARRAHPRDRVFHTQFVTIAAQHGWAHELKRDMTLALTREFRESGAEADAAAHENLLSALGRPGAVAASCGALACGAAEDAIARGAAFRAVRGRAENLLAFTREAFDLDEEDPRRERDPRLDRLGAALGSTVASALCSARIAFPSALGFDGVHEAEAVTAFVAGKKKGKKAKGNEGARAFHDILTGEGNEALPLDVLVCRDAAAAFKTTRAFKTPPSALEDAVFELVAAP